MLHCNDLELVCVCVCVCVCVGGGLPLFISSLVLCVLDLSIVHLIMFTNQRLLAQTHSFCECLMIIGCVIFDLLHLMAWHSAVFIEFRH